MPATKYSMNFVLAKLSERQISEYSLSFERYASNTGLVKCKYYQQYDELGHIEKALG